MCIRDRSSFARRSRIVAGRSSTWQSCLRASAARRLDRIAGEHALLAEALASLDRAVIEAGEAEERLAQAGEAQGLDPALAMTLAKATVAGAGALAMEAGEDPAQLRRNVTSPNGTTAAALEVLMNEEEGLAPLLRRAVAAAADRSRVLSK